MAPIAILKREREGQVRRFIVNSQSGARRRYVVRRTSKGQWQCSCPVWVFHRGNCKHIKVVRRAA